MRRDGSKDTVWTIKVIEVDTKFGDLILEPGDTVWNKCWWGCRSEYSSAGWNNDIHIPRQKWYQLWRRPLPKLPTMKLLENK